MSWRLLRRSFVASLVWLSTWMPYDTGARAGTAAGRVETGLTIISPILGHEFQYAIYLPERRANQPLPVLYLLHGRDDTETAWLTNGQIAATLDRMIGAGTLPPLAVVMPMAQNSWYVDDARAPGGFGRFATALSEDFMPGIERRYQLGGCRSARAIGGLSMGGYGAMLQAFTHPDMFASAISLSGSLFSDRTEDIVPRLAFYSSAMAGIFGEPFDFELFRSWTVFSRLAAAGKDVETLGAWLAAGDGDFAGILSGTVRLHQELRRRKIESHLRIYDGDHTWPLWTMAIEPALTWLAPRLASCVVEKNSPSAICSIARR